MDFDRAAQVAISWADAEGWNPGLDDAERFLAADPDSFNATETAQMYLIGRPREDVQKVFGVTTFEFG
jgi:hypothetical protein